jgi:hypothetical protein
LNINGFSLGLPQKCGIPPLETDGPDSTTEPIFGSTRFGFYIRPCVTKSVFTRRYQRFLTLLIGVRERQGLSQHQLVKKLKKPQSYVSKYERAERRLDVIEFLDLSYILEVDACKLIRKIGH